VICGASEEWLPEHLEGRKSVTAVVRPPTRVLGAHLGRREGPAARHARRAALAPPDRRAGARSSPRRWAVRKPADGYLRVRRYGAGGS
jgi:hypothetical protein